ncbi:MAG: acetolactate synthase [Rhodobacteraceae bacterium]|nr:acetolactate synthase [Paracoccaceae bacterium]
MAAAPVGAEQVQVPSGQPVEFVELIRDASGAIWRFRFLAPGIARDGGSVSVDTALGDMEALCRGFVIPRVAVASAPPGQVVISLSDRPVAFGTAHPDATQYFEAYRIEGETCVWEGF